MGEATRDQVGTPTAKPTGEPGLDPAVLAGLGLSVAATASAAIFVRLADPIPPELIAAGRVAITAVITIALAMLTLPTAIRGLVGRPREALWIVVAGLCLAAHFEAWIVSLSLTSVVRSVALVTTTPIFAGLLARSLGERVSPQLYLGGAIALIGSVVMVASPDALAGGSLVGDALALSGAMTAAAYLTIGRHVHAKLGDAMPLRDYFALVNIAAALGLWLAVGIRGTGVAGLAVESIDWAAIVFLGVVPGVIGHGLLNWAVRKAPVHLVSLTSLLEPLGAAGLAWIVLGEAVGVREGIGAAMLIAGVAVGLQRR